MWMQIAPRLLCLWPGLCQLWLRGQWLGLLAAVAFAGLLNLGIVTTFLWPEWLHSLVPISAWILAVVMVAVSVWKSLHSPAHAATNSADSQQDLFIQAQVEYLKAHWFEAEALLQEMLHGNPQDVEARLMLAGLYRHSRRKTDAEKQLALLQSTPTVDKWESEIERERELLKRLDDTYEHQHTSESEDRLANAA